MHFKLKFSSDKYLHQRKPFSKYISSKRKKTGNRKKMNILLYIRLSKLRSFYKSLKRGLFKDTQCIMVKYGLWKPNVKLRRTWCYDKWYLRKRVLFLLTSLFIFFFIFFEKKNIIDNEMERREMLYLYTISQKSDKNNIIIIVIRWEWKNQENCCSNEIVFGSRTG